MKNVLKNILFSICFTYLNKNRGNPPFIYSCARKKLWAKTGLVKMKKKKKTRSFPWGKGGKRGRERRYGWGWHEGEWRQCGGKHKERRKKWSCPIIYRKTPDFFLKTSFFINKHLKGIEHPGEYARKYFQTVFHSRDNVCSANSWIHG